MVRQSSNITLGAFTTMNFNSKKRVLVKLKVFIVVIGLYALAHLLFPESCNKNNCPDQTFNSMQDCELIIDQKKCKCVKLDSAWKAETKP